MKKRNIILLSVLNLVSIVLCASPDNIEIGKWRDHLSYYFTHNVCRVDNRILVAGQSSLFYYDPATRQMEKMTKVNGLSDAGLGVTAYDENTKTIVITYENSNIDIVQNNNVYNIPDIKNKTIEGSKSINSIFFSDGYAYLSCGFGIVVLDLNRHEIYDTWYLGDNSSAIKVNCVYIDDTAIFAGTVNGLLYADKYSKTLAASQTWKNKNLSHKNKEIGDIVPLDSKHLLVNILHNNSEFSSLIKYDGITQDTVNDSTYIVAIKNCNGKIGIIGYLSFDIYDTNLTQIYHISNEWNPVPKVSLNVVDFIIEDDDIWFAHAVSGLLHIPQYHSYSYLYDRELLYPNGPMSNSVYNITISNSGKVYVVPGGKDITNANKFIRADAFVYNGYYWDHLVGNTDDTIRDVLNIAIDPRDESHLMMSSWWNGVVEVRNDTIIGVYNSQNTDSMLISYEYNYRIATVGYDNSGNLLIANSLVPYGFVYLTFNNVWGNFYTAPYLLSDEVLGMALDYKYSYKLLFTSSNKILLVNNNGNMIWIDPNNGSLLQTSKINCITQDKDGEMWIGTDKGIKVIYSLYGAFDNATTTADIECNNIVYVEDSVAQYLLRDENVTCIMIDGANRKWIGTERNGIYVLSANGDKELYHFTLENSPLFSNKIVCLAQNPVTGEVFIGTDRGLISYRAESLESETEDKSLTVFPNPVRPDYDGIIAIKGFVKDSDVKITNANGRIVAHLKSLGGQAVWDGRNFNGQKVGTGVYFIFSSANEGQNKAVGKILIVK